MSSKDAAYGTLSLVLSRAPGTFILWEQPFYPVYTDQESKAQEILSARTETRGDSKPLVLSHHTVLCWLGPPSSCAYRNYNLLGIHF